MAKQRPTEFKVAFNRMAGRLSLLAALCIAVWGIAQIPYLPAVGAALHGHTDPDDAFVERIGSPAVVYDARAYRVLQCEILPCDHLDDDSLDYNVRIEVLDSGLIEGRGLAYDRDLGRLIVADAWEGLYGYWPDAPKVRPDRLPPIRVCPGGHCQDIDHRGLAYDPDTRLIVVTDVHQHRRSLRLRTGEFVRSIGGSRLLDGATDVTLVGHRIARLHTTAGPEPLATRRPRPTPPASSPTDEVNAPGPSAPSAGAGGLERTKKRAGDRGKAFTVRSD